MAPSFEYMLELHTTYYTTYFHNHFGSPVQDDLLCASLLGTDGYSFTLSYILADLALLELDHPVKLTERVNLPCMPTEGVYPSIGKQCVLAGWGKTSSSGNSAEELQQTTLPVIERKQCHHSFAVCVGKVRYFGSLVLPNKKYSNLICWKLCIIQRWLTLVRKRMNIQSFLSWGIFSTINF